MGGGGTFTTVGPDTFRLQSNVDAGGPAVGDYRFTNLRPRLGSQFPEADLEATVQVGGSVSYQGFRFPAGRCGADLTTCAPLYE